MRVLWMTWGVFAILAVPLFSQWELANLQLNESPTEVRKLLGEPTLVADINTEFRSWQYRIGQEDHDSFSHSLIFSKRTNTLLSISHTYDVPVEVEQLFPASSTKYYHYPETGTPEMVVRVNHISQDRLLLAFGSNRPGEPTTQLVLIHSSILPVFYPWLAKQIK